MIRRPPRSTLFPSPPLSRSLLRHIPPRRFRHHPEFVEPHHRVVAHLELEMRDDPMKRLRSEEHTSELQSPCNLVCRLLLEKKKKGSATSAAASSPRHDSRTP